MTQADNQSSLERHDAVPARTEEGEKTLPDSLVETTRQARRYFGAARAENTAAAYGQLAYYLYADLQFEAGDEAAAKSVELSDPAERKQAEKQFEQIAASAEAEQKRIEKEAEQGGKDAGQQELTDPFGALGGGSSVAPTAPAP